MPTATAPTVVELAGVARENWLTAIAINAQMTVRAYGALPLIAAVATDAITPASSNATTPHVCASMPHPPHPKAVRVCAMLATVATVIQSRNMLKA